MNSLSRKIILFLTILPILSVRSDDMENAKKCAEELPGMYDELCKTVKSDGEKVIAVKKKCIEYPEKLKALPVSLILPSPFGWDMKAENMHQ